MANVLAFGSGTNSGKLTVELYDVAADRRTILVDLSDVEWFDWSGDGEWLVFNLWDGTTSEIRIIRKDGTDMRTVLTSPIQVRQVIWDPNARH